MKHAASAVLGRESPDRQLEEGSESVSRRAHLCAFASASYSRQHWSWSAMGAASVEKVAYGAELQSWEKKVQGYFMLRHCHLASDFFVRVSALAAEFAVPRVLAEGSIRCRLRIKIPLRNVSSF